MLITIIPLNLNIRTTVIPGASQLVYNNVCISVVEPHITVLQPAIYYDCLGASKTINYINIIYLKSDKSVGYPLF